MNKKTNDEIIIELRLMLNQELYDEKVIDYRVFSKMQEYLLKKLEKEKNRRFEKKE